MDFRLYVARLLFTDETLLPEPEFEPNSSDFSIAVLPYIPARKIG